MLGQHVWIFLASKLLLIYMMKLSFLILISLSILHIAGHEAKAQLFNFNWSDLTDNLDSNEKDLAKESLQALKVYTLFSLIESHIKLDSYLYCLDPQKKPRSFYSTSQSIQADTFMFSATKTCNEALEELYFNIFETARQMRVHMGIAFGDIHGLNTPYRYSQKQSDRKLSKYYNMINTHPIHIYNELPRIAPLSPEEIEDAKSILEQAEETLIINYKEKHPQSLSHASERSLRESALIKQQSDSLKVYKYSIETVPVVAFLKNNLMLPPSELDLAVIRHSFEKLYQMNCNYISTHYLRPQIADNEDSIKNDLLKINPQYDKNKVIEETIKKVCQHNFSDQSKFSEYTNLPWLQDFIAMTNHAYRHQIYSEPSNTFGEPVNYDLDKVLKSLGKEAYKSSTNNNIAALLESDEILEALGRKLFAEKNYSPFHTPIDLTNQTFIRFLLLQTPAIDRLKKIPQWSQHGKILEKMAEKVNSTELWGDLKTAGTFIAAGFICQFGFKKITLLKNIGSKAINSFSRLFKKADSGMKANGELNISHYCHLGFGLWGSTYFYKLENKRYNSSFDEFFSSPFSAHLISNYDRLEGAKFSLTLETLFLIYDLYGLKSIVPNPQPLLKKISEKLRAFNSWPIKNRTRGAYGY